VASLASLSRPILWFDKWKLVTKAILACIAMMPLCFSFLHCRRRERLEQQLNQPPPLTLRDRISKWWETVPESVKSNKWHMDFFVQQFGASPAKIGPALYSLGWERRREWTPGKPHGRYWVKRQTKTL
jgi:hypothetical protein